MDGGWKHFVISWCFQFYLMQGFCYPFDLQITTTQDSRSCVCYVMDLAHFIWTQVISFQIFVILKQLDATFMCFVDGYGGFGHDSLGFFMYFGYLWSCVRDGETLQSPIFYQCPSCGVFFRSLMIFWSVVVCWFFFCR